ncbi:chemotaxis protein CheX [Histidinibacterium aquaticum]|uniref:Chemotaxis protein CheX n=1 Tax=Histidinibacterium aquaticum TaxID=2613962 RepID=A0A5J5GK96_9RHOB|nr:chemotaxis protein CheX [Histidinibacterium aquaticum]KAA9007974.1 chemotaxis protein CheX [Histidinibacterium aquaticum]
MDSQCQTFHLPPTASHDACAALHDFLVAARGTPVRLEGGEVRRTGARMALMMLSARRAWDADGTAFEIVPSEGLRTGLEMLGLSDHLLGPGALQ